MRSIASGQRIGKRISWIRVGSFNGTTNVLIGSSPRSHHANGRVTLRKHRSLVGILGVSTSRTNSSTRGRERLLRLRRSRLWARGTLRKLHPSNLSRPPQPTPPPEPPQPLWRNTPLATSDAHATGPDSVQRGTPKDASAPPLPTRPPTPLALHPPRLPESPTPAARNRRVRVAGNRQAPA